MDTPNWLRELRRAKLLLLLLGLSVASVIPYLFEYLASHLHYSGWFWNFFSDPVVKEVRGPALTGTLAALLLALFLGREEQALVRLELDKALEQFGDRVLARFMQEVSSTPRILEILGQRATPELLFQSALTVHLGDAALAQRAYQSVVVPFISQAGFVKEQVTNIKLMEPSHSESDPDLSEFFLAHAIMKYNQRIPDARFAVRCSSDYAEFVGFLADPNCHFAWLIPDLGEGFRKPSKTVFNVKRLAIDGKEGKVRHNYQWKYEIEIQGFGEFAGDDKYHEVFLEFETLLRKREHILFLAAERPTFNWTVSFDCSEATVDRESVFAIDSLVSVQRPKYTYTPSADKPTAIVVSVSDWVLPKGGVTFVWGLPSEIR